MHGLRIGPVRYRRGLAAPPAIALASGLQTARGYLDLPDIFFHASIKMVLGKSLPGNYVVAVAQALLT